jgi:hypothetical protein
VCKELERFDCESSSFLITSSRPFHSNACPHRVSFVDVILIAVIISIGYYHGVGFTRANLTIVKVGSV